MSAASALIPLAGLGSAYAGSWFAAPPKPNERTSRALYAQIEQATNRFQAGLIQFFPQFYGDWDAAVTQALLKRAIPLDRLPEKARVAVKHYQATHPGQEIAAIPLSGRTDHFTLLLDANTGEQLVALNKVPW